MRIILLSLLIATSSCSKESEWDPSIGFGTWNVTGPFCLSTDASPNYTAIEPKIALLDFDDVDNQHFRITDRKIVRTWTNGTCTLTSKEEVFRNSDNLFSTRLSREYSFVPEECSFNMSLFDETFEINAANTDFFGLNTDLREDLTYDVEEGTEDKALKVISQSHPDLERLWETFGCPAKDRIYYTFAPTVE